MSGGLVGLLDDIASLAKIAAASVDDVGAAAGKASAKAAGVVVDDTAVTPAYVQGVASKRELPIIKKIATGSLRNKLIFILPVALLLSEFVPILVEIILMFGGAFLCFEGAEKIWEKVTGHSSGHETPAALVGPDQEEQVVKSATRTDFILSAEIMVISLKEVIDEGIWSRAIILALVAVLITLIVYGVVALIVKMDDIGLALAQRESASSQRLGRRMVAAMPKVLKVLSVVGTAAMLWVGGHILLVGTDELGWHGPYKWVHGIEEDIIHGVSGEDGGFFGSALAWLFNTGVSFVIGLAAGAVLVFIFHQIQSARGKGHGATDASGGSQAVAH